MAKLMKGILAALTGKIGTVIASSWKGIPYIRAKADPSVYKKSYSDEQAATRRRFAVAAKFLASMRDLLEVTFKKEAIQMTGANSAQSHVMKHALTGDFPNYSIAYNKVLVSRGNLPGAETAAAIAAKKETIQFTWTSGELTGKARAKDKVIMVAYNARHNVCVYVIGSERSAGAGELSLPGFTGERVQTWLAFISEDEKDVATSVYTGEVRLV